MTETARRVVALGSGPPQLPAVLGAAYGRFNLLAAGAMLPRRLREGLGIPWSPRRDRLFRALLTANRAGALVVPGALRGRPVDALVNRERPLRLFAARRTRAA